MRKKLLILDRDGTLNLDIDGYSHNIRSCFLFDDVYKLFSSIDTLINICVVTNQSGIGRGYFTSLEMQKFNEKINFLIRSKTKHKGISKFFFCPHLPSDECECRKPKKKLIIDALDFFNCDAKEALLIGDKESDYLAGVNAGVESLLLIRSAKEYQLKILKNKYNITHSLDSRVCQKMLFI